MSGIAYPRSFVTAGCRLHILVLPIVLRMTFSARTSQSKEELPMDHIRVLICQVDDTDHMTEVAAFDMAGLAVQRVAAEQTLNELEASTLRTGTAIMRELLKAQ